MFIIICSIVVIIIISHFILCYVIVVIVIVNIVISSGYVIPIVSAGLSVWGLARQRRNSFRTLQVLVSNFGGLFFRKALGFRDFRVLEFRVLEFMV